MKLELHPKQTICFQSAAREILYGGAAGGGKALALDTPIPTPSGWTTMGEIQVGDSVFDESGKVCKVIAATPFMSGRPCYEIVFSDGEKIVADAKHQWVTHSNSDMEALRRLTDSFREERRNKRASKGAGKRPDLSAMNSARIHAYKAAPSGSIVTTDMMAETLFTKSGRSNHHIRVCEGLSLGEASLPIQPYVLGAWLGDGTSSDGGFTSADPQIINEIRKCGFDVNKRASKYGYGIVALKRRLIQTGVLSNKHIPNEYLRASEDQRLELLRGLMDTDGTINAHGTCDFDNCNLALIKGVHELVVSLGIKATITEKRAMLYGKDCGPAYRIRFTTTKKVFKLERKLSRLPNRERGTQKWRTVKSVTPIQSVPVRCIEVDSPSHLFLAGRSMIPTHNSHLLRVAAVYWAFEIPGIQIYLFRRHYAELNKNHMEGPYGFPNMLAEWIKSGDVKVNTSDNFIRFSNGSVIHLMHMQHEKDLTKIQGAEIHLCLIDEMTQFTDKMYRYIRSRCRLGGFKVPEKYAAMFPRIISGANPGGVSHNSVKASFIDPQPPFTVWKAPLKEGGMTRQYIPAKLEDNPTLLENDPDYMDQLEGLGDEMLVRALKDGDWNIAIGAYFADVWRQNRHVIPWFDIRQTSWYLDRSYDWGEAKPGAVAWFAEADGTEFKYADGRVFCPPRGSLICFGELYTWNGKPNEGDRRGSIATAKDVVRMEKEWGLSGRVRPGPADNMIFDVREGRCIADDMAAQGCRWERSDKSPGSRVNGWTKIRDMLRAAKQERPEAAGLYFMENCRHSIRTLPTIPRDEKKWEDVDTEAEDHVADAIRYRVLAKKNGMKIGRLGGL